MTPSLSIEAVRALAEKWRDKAAQVQTKAEGGFYSPHYVARELHHHADELESLLSHAGGSAPPTCENCETAAAALLRVTQERDEARAGEVRLAADLVQSQQHIEDLRASMPARRELLARAEAAEAALATVTRERDEARKVACVRRRMIDIPTAWAIVDKTPRDQHHERCSYRTDQMLCDCAVLRALEYVSGLLKAAHERAEAAEARVAVLEAELAVLKAPVSPAFCWGCDGGYPEVVSGGRAMHRMRSLDGIDRFTPCLRKNPNG